MNLSDANSMRDPPPGPAHSAMTTIRAHLERADQCNRQIDGLLDEGNLDKVREHSRLTQVLITNARQRADDWMASNG